MCRTNALVTPLSSAVRLPVSPPRSSPNRRAHRRCPSTTRTTNSALARCAAALLVVVKTPPCTRVWCRASRANVSVAMMLFGNCCWNSFLLKKLIFFSFSVVRWMACRQVRSRRQVHRRLNRRQRQQAAATRTTAACAAACNSRSAPIRSQKSQSTLASVAATTSVTRPLTCTRADNTKCRRWDKVVWWR